MKVLVVEDDAETAAYVVRGLREHGHAADHAADGQDGLMMAVGGTHDVLVVDRHRQVERRPAWRSRGGSDICLR